MHFINVLLYVFIPLYIKVVLQLQYMEIDLSKIEHRTPSISDAKAHFLAVQESYQETSKFLPEFVGMEHWTIPQHENYLRKFGSHIADIKNYLFFYEGKVIGAGHLFPSGWKRSGELVYWVRSGWDGLGIGEHIAKTMASSAGSNFGYKWIVIQTDRNNVASKRVAEKAGATMMMAYGYWDHFGKQSNMLVWVMPTPFGKISNRFAKDSYFDPFNPKLDVTYRYDYEGKMLNYAASDPHLIRKN